MIFGRAETARLIFIMRITIVVPTYNEAESIGVLARKIFDLGLKDLNMFVVDDGSPDGTAEVVRTMARDYPVELMSRDQKNGLGRAYAAAFREILSKKDTPDFIVQMDADLSHNPAVIPEMIKKMGECDLVLGSRYVKGGGIENWGFLRRLVSRWGNAYARFVLDLPYRDLTGGFKCWRRETLEKIDLNSLSSVGYNFQIETTYKAHQLGFKICEVPMIFTERKLGASKFNLRIMFESFIKVLLLRLKI